MQQRRHAEGDGFAAGVAEIQRAVEDGVQFIGGGEGVVGDAEDVEDGLGSAAHRNLGRC